MAAPLPRQKHADQLALPGQLPAEYEYLSDGYPPPGRFNWLWLALAFCAAVGIFALGAVSNARSTRPAVVGPFADKDVKPAPLTVHVAGEVHKPDVYDFPFDARVRDAIRKAGGPTASANLHGVNLAAYLEDGQKIEVPSRQQQQTVAALPAPQAAPALPEPDPVPADDLPAAPPAALGEVVPDQETSTPRKSKALSVLPKTERPKKEKPLPGVPRASTPTGSDSQNADPDYLRKNPLNLNTATGEQLELLPGVGPAMAAKILAARKEKGGFTSVEDLDDISGIGEKKMEALRPLVRVD